MFIYYIFYKISFNRKIKPSLRLQRHLCNVLHCKHLCNHSSYLCSMYVYGSSMHCIIDICAMHIRYIYNAWKVSMHCVVDTRQISMQYIYSSRYLWYTELDIYVAVSHCIVDICAMDSTHLCIVLQQTSVQWLYWYLFPNVVAFDKHHLGFLACTMDTHTMVLVVGCVSSCDVGLASIRKVLQNCLVFKSIYLVDFPITESLERGQT